MTFGKPSGVDRECVHGPRLAAGELRVCLEAIGIPPQELQGLAARDDHNDDGVIVVPALTVQSASRLLTSMGPFLGPRMIRNVDPADRIEVAFALREAMDGIGIPPRELTELIARSDGRIEVPPLSVGSTWLLLAAMAPYLGPHLGRTARIEAAGVRAAQLA